MLSKKHIIFISAVIIFVLAGIIYFVINPAEQIKNIHNQKRTDDIEELYNILETYKKDNNEKIPPQITGEKTIIGSTEGQVNICEELVPKYVKALPYDKNSLGAHFTSCKDYNLGYTIKKDLNNRLFIEAPYAEQGINIQSKNK